MLFAPSGARALSSHRHAIDFQRSIFPQRPGKGRCTYPYRTTALRCFRKGLVESLPKIYRSPFQPLARKRAPRTIAPLCCTSSTLFNVFFLYFLFLHASYVEAFEVCFLTRGPIHYSSRYMCGQSRASLNCRRYYWTSLHMLLIIHTRGIIPVTIAWYM